MWNVVALPIVWPPTSRPRFSRDTALTRPMESTSTTVGGIGVITNRAHVTGDGQQVAHTHRVGAEQFRLQGEQGLVAGRELQHDIHAGLLSNQDRQRQRAQSRPAHTVGHVNRVDATCAQLKQLVDHGPRLVPLGGTTSISRTQRRLAKARLSTDFSDGTSGPSAGTTVTVGRHSTGRDSRTSPAPGRQLRQCRLDLGDVIGRRATASPDETDPPLAKRLA